MRFYDFDIGASTYADTFDADARHLTGLARPVVEAFRYELASHPPVDGAAFRKLLVELVEAAGSAAKRPPILLIDVFVVPVAVKEADLRGDLVRKDAALLDATAGAFAIAKREVGWSHPAVASTIAALRERSPVGWIELNHLRRRDRRTGHTYSVVYDVHEGTANVWVLESSEEGAELRRELVADLPGAPLELFFPVRSSIIVGREFVLRDRDRGRLASLALDGGS